MKKELLLCLIAVSVLSGCSTGRKYTTRKISNYESQASANRAYRYQGTNAPLYEGSRTKVYNHGCDYGNFPTAGSGCGGYEACGASCGQTIWPVQTPMVQAPVTQACTTCTTTYMPPPPPPRPITQTFTVPVQLSVTTAVPAPTVSYQQTMTSSNCASCTTGVCLNECVKVYSPNDFAGGQRSPTIINNVGMVPYSGVPSVVQGGAGY